MLEKRKNSVDDLKKLLSIYRQHFVYQKKLVLTVKTIDERRNLYGEIRNLQTKIDEVESELSILKMKQR